MVTQSKKTIDYKLLVDAIPEDLRPPLPPVSQYLASASSLYQRVIDSRFVWRVNLIDEVGNHWIEVEFENDDGVVEHHSLVIDDDTCRRIECDPYEVNCESADDGKGLEEGGPVE
ncbi:MAG: hypothetical protein GY794_07075 [bacterium]|nr:hypothetical protein [bacterium]